MKSKKGLHNNAKETTPRSMASLSSRRKSCRISIYQLVTPQLNLQVRGKLRGCCPLGSGRIANLLVSKGVGLDSHISRLNILDYALDLTFPRRIVLQMNFDGREPIIFALESSLSETATKYKRF